MWRKLLLNTFISLNLFSASIINSNSIQNTRVVKFLNFKSKLELQVTLKKLSLEKRIQENQEEKLLESISNIIFNDNSKNLSKEESKELAKLILKVNNEYVETYEFESDIPKLLSFIRVESHFNINAVSNKGAKGLMQLLDSTGKYIANELGIKEYNPFDPEQNIRIGWYYYNKDKERLGEIKAIVAYNNGYKNLNRAVSRHQSRDNSYLRKIQFYDEKYSKELEQFLEN